MRLARFPITIMMVSVVVRVLAPVVGGGCERERRPSTIRYYNEIGATKRSAPPTPGCRALGHPRIMSENIGE